MSRRFSDLEAESDESLVRMFVSSRDNDALGVLLARHEQKVFGIALRALGNRSDALDAAQEVFLTVFRKAASFQHRSSFSTWLYRLTINACYDLARKRARSPVLGRQADSEAPDPSDATEAAIAVHAALQALPAEQRAAVVLRDLYDLPYDQIAEATGVPAGTVKSRISRGRVMLAEVLDRPGSGPGGVRLQTDLPKTEPGTGGERLSSEDKK